MASTAAKNRVSPQFLHTTLGEELLPGKRFEVYLTDRTLWEYVDVIRAKVEPGGGDPSIEYFFVPGAICVGTRGTIEEFQIRHAESEALARAAPDRESALLDATFRPDFQEASWATVANVISQATQIQIIVDADLWSGTRTITWRAAEPLTLREVMDRLGKEMRAIYRVKDGRIFVFPR